MGFNKKVVKLLKDKKRTKAELAKAAQIPYTTLDSMLKRDSDATRLRTIYKIADYLDVPVEELVFDDYSNINKKTELSEAELLVIENFRQADERGKEIISALAGLEASRVKSDVFDVKKHLKKDFRKIPIYMSPAAAGSPLPILADDYSMVNVENAPDNASFGIKIMGDSMEPVIEDSSIVWVNKNALVENGDVGIFVLNGESLCKKLFNENGICKLVSFNQKYPPIEVLETDDLRVVGKVITR